MMDEFTWLCCLSVLCISVIGNFGNAKAESTKYRALFVRMSNLRLTTIPAKIVPKSQPEDCARACAKETEFECKSFDIESTTSSCRLQNYTHEDPFVSLQISTTVDHYRRNYKRLFHRLPNHIITYDHLRKVPGVSVEQCARRCILELSFKCMGFDYEIMLQNCWLTNKTTQTSDGVMKQTGSDFYERIIDGPLSNFINFGQGSLQQIEGEHIYSKSMIGVALEACAHLCLAETAFSCQSFDYNFDDQSCHMSPYVAANVYGLNTDTTENKKRIHFEIKDEFINEFYATPYAAVLGHNEKTYYKVTPSSCAWRCLQEMTFICRSFDYQTREGTCLLSTKTGSDVGGLTSRGYGQVHHFEMKPHLDCGGLLTEEKGNFASPNWPRNYPHNMNCSWTIIVPKFKVIRLVFRHFDLHLRPHYNCSGQSDYIYVTEWVNNTTSRRCLTSTNREYLSVTNNITLSFVSDSTLDAQGFRVFYSTDWPCGGTLREDNGQLSSPHWPSSYPPSTTCMWRIISPARSRIELSLISLNLEEHISGDCKSAYDYLHVYGENKSDTLNQIYCGEMNNKHIVAPGNIVHIIFRSDERVQKSGFHMIYRFLIPEVTTLRTTSLETDMTSSFSVEMTTHVERNISNDVHMSLTAMFSENRVHNVLNSRNMIRKQSSENSSVQYEDKNGGYPIITPQTPVVVTVETDFRQALIILIVVFIVIVFIIILVMLITCRYYRNRVPKRRSVPNFIFTEENVSLYDKENTINGEVQKEYEETESINLPQPGSAEPLPDVSFINPMYLTRNQPSTDIHPSSERSVRYDSPVRSVRYDSPVCGYITNS